MPAVPLSLDENHRLDALRALAILDTPAEPAFDALCRLAGQALDAPIAFIGLLDAQRLWFKARLGLALPELDRQLAFGPHLPIAAPPIADLTQDARFSAHPLVSAGPRLRAYAGAPLVDAHGVVLGTLAVFDTTPREFSAAQLHSLRDLADLVMCALRERQQAQQLAHLAMTDPLTGLANRAHFERTLHAEFGRAVRLGEPFTLLLLNLDGFKAVNDGFGHPLVAAGPRLRFYAGAPLVDVSGGCWAPWRCSTPSRASSPRRNKRHCWTAPPW